MFRQFFPNPFRLLCYTPQLPSFCEDEIKFDQDQTSASAQDVKEMICFKMKKLNEHMVRNAIYCNIYSLLDLRSLTEVIKIHIRLILENENFFFFLLQFS